MRGAKVRYEYSSVMEGIRVISGNDIYGSC